jgi:5'-deoxynucleotidase YfbR-like HD superfamily hydrolase
MATKRAKTPKDRKIKKPKKRVARGKKAAENVDELLDTLEQWQKVEKETVSLTRKISKSTDNVLVQTLMKIIQQDSRMHHKVQQAIIDSFTEQAITLRPEELGEMWEMVEKHSQMEKDTIRKAEDALDNCRLFPQRQLLMYLLEDEKKHDKLLTQLANFKRKIYPYM